MDETVKTVAVARKLEEGNSVLTRIMAQQKIFLIGSEHDLPANR
jgi:hypothetical protein